MVKRRTGVARFVSAAALISACDAGSMGPDPSGAVQYIPDTSGIQAPQAGGPATVAPVAQPTAVAPIAAAPAAPAAVPSAAVPSAAVPSAAAPSPPMPPEEATTPPDESSSTAATPPQPAAATPPASEPASGASAGSGSPAAMPPMATDVTPSFDAGSGTLQPDGKTVVYHIPDGTGGNDWNDKLDPIRVQRGMTLRLIDDDKSTRAGGHYLHTYGQPCPHGSKAIGKGYDCVISAKAPVGLQSGVAEHNILNGIGHLYIEVVAD